MRSIDFQNSFAQVYKDFFSKNNLIISTTHIMHWGNTLNINNLRIKQKIPNKIFLGININSRSKKINLGGITYFSHNTKTFESRPLTSIIANTNIEKITYFIQSQLIKFGFNKGIRISILTENERGTGVDFIEVASVLLSVMIHILSEKTDIKTINDYDNFIKSTSFKSIYDLAITISKEFGGESIGTTAFAAMTNNWLPIGGLGNTEQTKKIPKSAFSLGGNVCIADLIGCKQIINQPMIDFGIIHFGSYYDEYYIKNLHNNIRNEYADVCHLPKDTTDPTIQINTYLSTKLLIVWKYILKHPGNEQIIESFIDTISQHGTFSCFLEQDHKTFTDTAFLFEQAKTYSDEKIGIMPISSAKNGGSFLFATKYKKSRDTMEKLLILLQEHGHKKACYQYLSRIDGFSHESLKVEQYISQNLFSSYVKEDSARLQDTHGQTQIGDYRDLINRSTKGILFNTIDKKIYINQENVTHKDLFTQSGTIEIIEILFKNMGKYINNKKLPPSSYSKNKNDMTGKIILPLQQLAEKKFNKKLNLKCTGSIVNFDIMLDKGDIPIHLIKKIY